MIHVALDYYTTTTSHLSFPWKISTPVYTVRNVAIYMHALNGENLMQNSVEKRRSFSCEALGRLNDYYRASIVHIQLHKLVVSVSCSNSFLPGLLTGSKGGQALIEAAICTPLLLHWFCCFHQLPFVSIHSLSTSLSLPLSHSFSLSPSPSLPILTCFGVVSIESWILQTEVHQIPGKKYACVYHIYSTRCHNTQVVCT